MGFFRLFTARPIRGPGWFEAVLPLRGKWLQRAWAAILALFVALMIVPVGYSYGRPGGTRPHFIWEAFIPSSIR